MTQSEHPNPVPDQVLTPLDTVFEEITLAWANLWRAHQDGEPCAECTNAVDSAYEARYRAALAGVPKEAGGE